MNSAQRKTAIRFGNFLINKVTRKQFYLGGVCDLKEPEAWLSSDDVKHQIVEECGTTGCAIGQLPRFNPRRFAYAASNYSILSYVVLDKVTKTRDYIDIAVTYLGFTYNEADFLFTPNDTYSLYPTPQTVGKRILGLIRKDPKVLKLYKKYVGD